MSDRAAETSDVKGHPVDGFANDHNFPHDMNVNLSSFSLHSALLTDPHILVHAGSYAQLVTTLMLDQPNHYQTWF